MVTAHLSIPKVTMVVALAAVLLQAPGASAEDPPPVVLGPVPLVADVSVEIWEAGTGKSVYASHLNGGSGVMRVYLTRAHPISRDVVRVCNVAPGANRVKVKGTAGNSKFMVRYLRKGHNITGKVVAGTFRTRSLIEDECMKFRMQIRRTDVAQQGESRRFKIAAAATHEVYGPGWAAVVAHANRPSTGRSGTGPQ